MRELTVSQDGRGQYGTISEAVAAVPFDSPAVIRVGAGKYREKLFLEKKDLRLVGAGPEKTVISWGDGALRPFGSGGEKLGTFRSYTAFFGGGRISIKNLTVENTAGDGDSAGQAIAVYADADEARFENVRILGRQDTLFLAPLPDAPRILGSFAGPSERSPRKNCRDVFLNCFISGDVDFIFGGAYAVFCGCELFSRDRGRAVNGFVTAACTPESRKDGFVFYRCRLESDCAPGTVFLGRPWRKSAGAAFVECGMESHIAAPGWKLWNEGEGEERSVRFSEYGNFGPGADRSGRVPWACALSPAEAERLKKEAETALRSMDE